MSTPTPYPGERPKRPEAVGVWCQPIEGLLYDLNILPEQLEEFSQNWRIMKVIQEMHAHFEKLENHIDALEKLLPQRDEVEGWQPIETAPKDGTKIIVYFPALGKAATAHWSKSCNNRTDGKWPWSYHVGSQAFNRWEAPTHWMPLPPAPGSASLSRPKAEKGEPRDLRGISRALWNLAFHPEAFDDNDRLLAMRLNSPLMQELDEYFKAHPWTAFDKTVAREKYTERKGTGSTTGRDGK